MQTINAKRQGGFFAIGIGFALIALATAGGLTINAATTEDDQRVGEQQQVQVAATPTETTDTTQ